MHITESKRSRTVAGVTDPAQMIIGKQVQHLDVRTKNPVVSLAGE